jgi:phosphatidylglycerol lysyltransferase
VLLFSGATPAEPGRLGVLARIFPLGIIEASHFAGSVTGAALLVLSHGLARRLDAAYYVSSGLILIGMTASLLKGFDYEEAVLLSVVLLALYSARSEFDRRAEFFEAKFSAAWVAAVCGAIGASIWLGLFAFKHVDYAHDLCGGSSFEATCPGSSVHRSAPRSVVLIAAVARLVRPAPPEAVPPSDADLNDASRVLASQNTTLPNLVYLRDKSLLFNEDRSGFVMYAVRGRSWVAMGDPVVAPERMSDLIRQFLERCDDFGGTPVFYQVGPAHLHRYADFGFTFVKLGEEARLNLHHVLDGREPRGPVSAGPSPARESRLPFQGDFFGGCSSFMPQLRDVSDDWLRHKSAAEKGFSLGFFDEDYLSRFPVAVVEDNEGIVAFCNLWLTPQRTEMSLDLMRYSREAPRDIMETLLVEIAVWGKEQGYDECVLGMAPLSGFERSPVSPLWNRVGTFLYDHADALYGFQGLRAYKEKFKPDWTPRYLAYPGGLRLARVLADISALIAGGYRKIFLK